MFSSFLILHLTGAFSVFALIGYSIFAIIKGKQNQFTPLSQSLWVGLIVQVITGCGLELTSVHPALFTVFCSKIALYVLMVACAEMALYWKMHHLSMQYSYRFAYITLVISSFSVILTGLFLH